MPTGGTRGSGHKETCDVPSEPKKTLLESDQMQGQAAQGGCGAST